MVRSLTGILQPVLGHVMVWEARRMMRRFRRSLGSLREVQEANLLAKLRRNADSDFGRRYDFAAMRSADDFRAAVPITTYADYQPYVEQVRSGQPSAMFGRRQRIHMFAMTSGTDGTPKYVPVPDAFLKEYRRGWMTWGLQAFLDHPLAFDSRILQMVSAMDDERAPCGLPCGAISGLTASMQRRALHNVYVLPPCATGIKDTPSKYYVALLLALPHRRLIVVSANPSTLLGLARTLEARSEELLRDLRDGTLSDDVAVPDDVRHEVRRRLRVASERWTELRRAAEASGGLRPKDVFEMPFLGCWKGGTLSLYLREFPAWFAGAVVRDIGLIASEGRMTIPLGDESSAGVLDAESQFFEFLPARDGERIGDRTLLPHELQAGAEYFLVMTNSAGLYRYDIGDLVRVEGSHGETPLLVFLSKGSHYANLTGEKISEHQVVEAVGRALSETGMSLSSYCLAPVWGGDMPRYVLLVEASEAGDDASARRLAAAVERLLRSLNIEYNAKRDSDRLAPVRLRTVADGTWRAYDLAAVAERRRGMEQYKHKFLVGDVEFEGRFPALAEYGPQE